MNTHMQVTNYLAGIKIKSFLRLEYLIKCTIALIYNKQIMQNNSVIRTYVAIASYRPSVAKSKLMM